MNEQLQSEERDRMSGTEEACRYQTAERERLLSNEVYRRALLQGMAAVDPYLRARANDRGAPRDTEAGAPAADDTTLAGARDEGEERDSAAAEPTVLSGSAVSLLRRPSLLLAIASIAAVSVTAVTELTHGSRVSERARAPSVKKAADAAPGATAQGIQAKRKPQPVAARKTQVRTATDTPSSRAIATRTNTATSSPAAARLTAGGGTRGTPGAEGRTNGSYRGVGSHPSVSSQSVRPSPSSGSTQPDAGSPYIAGSGPTRGGGSHPGSAGPSGGGAGQPTDTSTRSRASGATGAGGITISGGG